MKNSINIFYFAPPRSNPKDRWFKRFEDVFRFLNKLVLFTRTHSIVVSLSFYDHDGDDDKPSRQSSCGLYLSILNGIRKWKKKKKKGRHEMMWTWNEREWWTRTKQHQVVSRLVLVSRSESQSKGWDWYWDWASAWHRLDAIHDVSSKRQTDRQADRSRDTWKSELETSGTFGSLTFTFSLLLPILLLILMSRLGSSCSLIHSCFNSFRKWQTVNMKNHATFRRSSFIQHDGAAAKCCSKCEIII